MSIPDSTEVLSDLDDGDSNNDDRASGPATPRSCERCSSRSSDVCSENGMLRPFHPRPAVLSSPQVRLPVNSARSRSSCRSGSSNASLDDTNGEADRIGTFFGYSVHDLTVPKAAYEAMLHRAHSLESSLGQANRDVRQHVATIAEQHVQIQRLEQALETRDVLLKAAKERERSLEVREKDVASRELSLESVAKQQRRLLKRRLGLPIAEDGELFSTTNEPPQNKSRRSGGVNRNIPDDDGQSTTEARASSSLSFLPQLAPAHNPDRLPAIVSRSHTSFVSMHLWE